MLISSKEFHKKCIKLITDSDIFEYLYDQVQDKTLNKFKLVSKLQQLLYVDENVEYVKVTQMENTLLIQIYSYRVKNTDMKFVSQLTLSHLDKFHITGKDTFLKHCKTIQ